MASHEEEGSEHADDEGCVPSVHVSSAAGSSVVLIVDEGEVSREDSDDFSGDTEFGSVQLGDAHLLNDGVCAEETEENSADEFHTDAGHGFVVVWHLVLVEEGVQQVRDHREEAEANDTEAVEIEHLARSARQRDVGIQEQVGIAVVDIRRSAHNETGEEDEHVTNESDDADPSTLSGIDDDVVDPHEGEADTRADEHGGKHGITADGGSGVGADCAISAVVGQHDDEIFVDALGGDVGFGGASEVVFDGLASFGIREGVLLDGNSGRSFFFGGFCCCFLVAVFFRTKIGEELLDEDQAVRDDGIQKGRTKLFGDNSEVGDGEVDDEKKEEGGDDEDFSAVIGKLANKVTVVVCRRRDGSSSCCSKNGMDFFEHGLCF